MKSKAQMKKYMTKKKELLRQFSYQRRRTLLTLGHFDIHLTFGSWHLDLTTI